MAYDHQKMGRVIKHIRKQKKLTQEVLSGLAGIGRTHLVMIESGKKNANIETLEKIAAAMGIKMSELFLVYEDFSDQ